MSLERNSKLVSRKFIHYLIPSILMIFAMQFGSLLDGILVGNLIGNDALAASALVVPILYVIQMPGFALGIGGSIVVSNRLGKRDIEGAKKAFSISVILGMAISFVFFALSFFVSEPLAKLFGESSLEYSYPYVYMYILTVPVLTIALLMGSFMAVDNCPKLSSALYIVANVGKVGLEILFIQVFNMGMYGAALSTAAGYLLGLLLLIPYIKSKKRLLSLTFKIKGSGLKEILKTSSTSALNMTLTAAQMLVINIFIGRLITENLDLLAYGLVANMVFVFDLFCGGIINLIPTLCAIFYGEKDYYSLKSVTKKIYYINIGVTLAITAFIAIFPQVYSIIFGFDDMANMSYVSAFLRVYLFSFIFYEINKFSMNYYPSIDKNIVSIITVLLRELVIVIPLTLVLLFADGLMGYCIAATITEFATLIITYAFILIYNKKKKIYHGFFMLEKVNPKSLDVSLNNNFEEVSLVSERLTNFAKDNGISNREAQIVGLAAEEIASNIVTYGYKKGKQNYIDVNLRIISDTLILRIRDDGLPFDPTKYEFDDDESYSTSGIKLIQSLVDKMTYMRTLNLNNTIFEIKCKGE